MSLTERDWNGDKHRALLVVTREFHKLQLHVGHRKEMQIPLATKIIDFLQARMVG